MNQFIPKRVSSSLWLAALIITAAWLASAALPASAQTCKDYGGTFTCPPTPPSTQWGNVCGTAPSYYCSYAPEGCAFNESFDCQSCSCKCDTVNYPCAGCTASPPGVVIGELCDPPFNGRYQDACGTCACDTGYQVCPSTNTCVAVAVCPVGTTFDPCTSTCTSPYILRSPADPQVGYIDIVGYMEATGYLNMGGDITSGGDLTVANDVYLNDGKAIRIDDAADTKLNLGNFGGGRADLSVQGRLGVGHLDTPGYSIDVRSFTSMPMINLKDEGIEWTGLRLSRDSGPGAGDEDWFIGMNATDESLRFRGGSSNDWLTVTAAGQSQFAGDVLLATNRQLRLSPGATPVGGSVGNGSMYYDLTDDKFKCYENGGWKDCVADGAAIGSGTGPQVAVWQGDGSIGGDSDFTWIDTLNDLVILSASTANPPLIRMNTASATTPNLPGPGLVLTTDAASGGYMLKMQQGGGDYFAVSDESGNTNYLVVGSGGNVGIGDTSPTNKLDVAGAIGVNDQTVVTSGRAIQNVTGYTQTSGDFSYSGAGNFSVSSTNPILFGSTAAVAGGSAFILSPGAQPTAAEGGMYYDSSEKKFKCYEGTPGSGGAWVNCAGSGGSVGGSGGADRVAFWNDTDQLSSASDFKWVDSTKRLGLGATSPLYGLDLRSATSALISVDDTAGTNYAGLRIARSGEKWFVGMDDAGLFQLRRDSATNDLTIDGSGNVGIGDSSPTNRLDVTGSIGIGDTTIVTSGRGIQNVTGYSQSSGNFAVAGAGSFTTSSGAVTLAGNTRVNDGKTFRIGAFTTATEPSGQPGMMYYNTDTNKFRCFEGAGWKDCGGQSGATFGSGVDGQVAYWSGSNQLTGENSFFYDDVTNRLGLGTTAPGFLLDIVQPSGTVTDTAIVRIHQDNVSQQLWTGLRLDRAGAIEKWFIGMDSGDDDLLLRGAGVNRMVISAAGNVGIGNETPVNKLDVTGQVNSTGGYAVGGTNVVSSARAIQNVTGYSQGSGNFSVSGGGTASFGTGAFNITSGTLAVSAASTFSGTVNINNHLTLGSGRYLLLSPGGNPQPSPTAGMMYYDSVANKFRCAQGSTPVWMDCISDTGGSTVTGGGAANQVTYWQNASTLTGSNNLFFTGTRLGITETAPGFPLDVAPTGGDLPIIRLHAPSGSSSLYTGLRLDRDKGVEQWFIGLDDTDNSLKFRRSAVNQMVITTGGNVGINAGAPAERLTVGGNISATGTVSANSLVTNTFKMGSSTDGYVLTYDVGTGQGLWKEAPGGSFPTLGALGETIYSDGSSWQANTTIYNNGLNKIVLGPQSGTVRVGVGIDFPDAKFQVMNGDVQFSPMTGSTTVYSTGPRLTWYDTQHAFRAGESSTAWNNVIKIGINSAAFGYNTLASGTNSFAIGYSTSAIGNASFSSGWLSEANNSFSTAMGYSTKVTGAGAVGIGYFANTGGSYSVAIGKYVNANATNSYVFGKGNDLGEANLVNNISDSIMLGVGSTIPTVFIEGAPTAVTYGRVGIGNTSPQATMDVTGTLRLSGALTTDPVGAVNGTIYYNSSSNTFRCYTSGAWADCMGGGGGGGSSLPAGTLNQTLRNNGTTWEATADLLVSLAGQLDFSGGLSSGNGCTVYTDGNMACSGTIQSTGGSLVGDLLTLNPASAPASASDGMVYYDDTLNKFQCRENGAWVDCISSLSGALPSASAGDTMRFDGTDWVANDVIYNDGNNVGIGQTSPTSKLHVVSASTTNPALYSESFQHDAIKGRTTADGKTAVVGDASGTNAYGFYGYAPNGYGGQFQGANGVYGVASTGYGGHFTSVSGVGLYASSTSGYGAIIENGNVGIGLTNPAYELDVNGTINADELCIGTDCKSSWAAVSVSLPAGTANQTLRHNGTDWIASSVLTNDGTSRVGVNMTSPGYPLDVRSTASTAVINANDQSGTSIYTGLRLARGGTSSGTERWFFGMDNFSNDLMLKRNGSTNAMSIDIDDGSAFFSATNPASTPMSLIGQYSVNNNAQTVLSVIRRMPLGGPVGVNGIGVSVDLMAAANNGAAYDTARLTGTFTDVTVGSLDSTLAFYTMDDNVFVERLFIDDDGEVGINTTSPAYQLDVNGQANATELCIAGDCRTVWPSGGAGSLPAGAAGQTLRHNGTDWVANSVLYNNGTNVGIGQTSPTSKLHVTSAAAAPAVLVASTTDDGLKATTTAASKSAVVGDASGSLAYGVFGYSPNGYGGRFEGGGGVYGIANWGYGGYFSSTSGTALSVVGHASSTIYASNDAGGSAVTGVIAGANGYGGNFTGGTGTSGIGVLASASAGTAVSASTGSGTAANLSSTSGTALYVSSGGYGAVIASGNVGIGFNALTPDDFKLEVDGSVGPALDDTYDLGSPTRRWRDIYLGPSSLHIGNSSTDELTLSYNLGKLTMGVLTLDSVNGRVGIGVPSPTSRFQVGSDSASYPAVYGKSTQHDGIKGETSGSQKAGVSGLATGSWGFGVYGYGDGNSTTGVYGRGQSTYAGGFWSVEPYDSVVKIGGETTAANGLLKVLELSHYVTGGSGANGIGTTIQMIAETNAGTGAATGHISSWFTSANATGFDIDSAISFSTHVDSAFGERMRIDGLGNLAVGTTASNGYKVNVAGSLNANQVCINGNCQSSWPAGGGGISGSGTTNYIPRWTGSGSLGNSIIYQNSSTNRVSLGYLADPTNPWAQLDVRSALCGMSTCGPAIQGTHQWDQPGVRGQSYYGTGVVGQSTNGGDGVSGSGYRGITGSGTVGVYGTGTMYGVSGWSDSGEGLSAATATGHAIHFHVNNSAGYGLYGESGKVFLQDAVGIGTTSIGTYKVNVSGSLNATQLCINGNCQSSWPSGGGGVTAVYSGGAGITVSPSTGNVYVYNTGDTNAADDITSISAGSGISVSGSGNSRTITSTDTLATVVARGNSAGAATFTGGVWTSVYGQSSFFPAIKGEGLSAAMGVEGTSVTGTAIHGVSSSGWGGDFTTNTGVALHATGTAGYAGHFEGTVGIKIPPTLAYGLYVNGSIYAIGGWAGSDVRWKKDIEELDDSLDKVLELRGVSYNWRTAEFPELDFEDRRQIGLIAQEVEPILPELVKTDDKGFKAVSYEKMTAVLIEAVKELNQKLEEAISDTLRLAPDGSVAVPADLVAEDNTWGRSSGWLSCPETGKCSCPDGYFMTEMYNRGQFIKCNQL